MAGNLKGTPEVDNWEPKEEERTVEIPVKLKKRYRRSCSQSFQLKFNVIQMETAFQM